MKITKTLSRGPLNSFFRNDEISICQEAAFHIAGIADSRQQIARVTVATKNPKKKGFKKAKNEKYEIVIGGTAFCATSRQFRFLALMGVELNGFFWVKVEIA